TVCSAVFAVRRESAPSALSVAAHAGPQRTAAGGPSTSSVPTPQPTAPAPQVSAAASPAAREPEHFRAESVRPHAPAAPPPAPAARACADLRHGGLPPREATGGPAGRDSQAALRGRDQEELGRVFRSGRSRGCGVHQLLQGSVERDPRRRSPDLLTSAIFPFPEPFLRPTLADERLAR